VTGLRCWLGNHSWRANITAGGRSVLVSCKRCSQGPDLIPISNRQHANDLPTRPAAGVIYDAWSGQLTGPIAVDVAEVLALAAVLLGVATKGEDPRQLLDTLSLAMIDPDRETR
jgi:hypothetical protein